MTTVYRIIKDEHNGVVVQELYHGDDAGKIFNVLVAEENGVDTLQAYTYVQHKGTRAKKWEHIQQITAQNAELSDLPDGAIVVVGDYEHDDGPDGFKAFLAGYDMVKVAPLPSKHPITNIIEFFTHPGTWTFGALALILTGIFVPVAAPGLILAAAIMMPGLAALSLIRSIKEYVNELWAKNPGKEHTFSNFLKLGWKDLKKWASDHPVQAAIVFSAVALLVTALTLTIGFFTGGGALAVVGGALVATGGGAFAFMAPVFAAIAAPFAVAAATVGAEVSLAALAGASFVLTALCVPDVFRRFTNWLNGFVSRPVPNNEDVVKHWGDEVKIMDAPKDANVNKLPLVSKNGCPKAIENIGNHVKLFAYGEGYYGVKKPQVQQEENLATMQQVYNDV